ncbi:hypothetical protein SAMN02745217_03374 [Anaerocolumna xylanovorans DSM 12503]|uniref:Uncharacterized protein n=1 Tax=Anaerocolumna xylanovorans DSM 12503 TaxID=1121345 RepID=A0A1M7YH05_9FIRM|nr:hypothetical protein SAMN02745217_03374 [Anaerocolumna xylanovorans DSM 12503]
MPQKKAFTFFIFVAVLQTGLRAGLRYVMGIINEKARSCNRNGDNIPHR